MERFLLFLPEILILGALALAGRYYNKWFTANFSSSKYNNITWVEKNPGKTYFVIFPIMCIFAPALEELVFRAWLIIAFSEISAAAWPWLIASSILFGLTHWKGDFGLGSKVFDSRKNPGSSDNFEVELEKARADPGNEALVPRFTRVIVTTLLGLAFGYYGIKYQSILVSFGFHAAWNALIPLVVVLISLLLQLIILILFLIWTGLQLLFDLLMSFIERIDNQIYDWKKGRHSL